MHFKNIQMIENYVDGLKGEEEATREREFEKVLNENIVESSRRKENENETDEEEGTRESVYNNPIFEDNMPKTPNMEDEQNDFLTNESQGEEPYQSPYMRRTVEVRKKLEAVETRISKSIFSLQKDGKEIIFETKDGHKVERIFFKTLIPSAWIYPKVIDCWSMFLNDEEKRKANTTPLCFYFPTRMLTNEMLDRDTSYDKRLEKFEESMNEAMKNYPHLKDLKKVGIVFFPILHRKHYYMICFNLRKCSVHLIDNEKTTEDIVDTYGMLPYNLWWIENNMNDSGVMLMRHMETFKGQGPNNWDSEIEKDQKQQKKQLTKLRSKYVTKILVNDINIHNNKIIEESLKFEKLTKEEQKQVVNHAMENYEERFQLIGQD
ncbi:unnamed protein product [Lactuca saligna]|uniref:Ubiquitin-like protease family profile domain-containing protein n=1 Tax=Lactuca saligna TaxID=75948 RepID=A0AA35ZI32_LACSI|nr:unnamed protein product [Lactuca saligna]